MSLTGNTRATVAAGTALLAGGLAFSGHGLIRSHATCSMAGIAIVVTALTLIALAVIRKWIGDARDERRDLATARREADAEQRKYFALQAALEGETTRLRRDMALEQAQNAAALIAEREAMQAQLEEQRLQIATEAFRTGVEMERAGMLKPDAPAIPANLIQFPKRTPDHERSRGHEVVGP
jgi:hypothetical protein